jgi:hypothetical protein
MMHKEVKLQQKNLDFTTNHHHHQQLHIFLMLEGTMHKWVDQFAIEPKSLFIQSWSKFGNYI